MHDPRSFKMPQHSDAIVNGKCGNPVGARDFTFDPASSARGMRAVAPGRPYRERDGGRSLTVRCFGGLEILVDDRPIGLHVIRPRARSVLRMLCLQGGRPVPEDRLVQAFWPGGPKTGRHNLQVAVSAIRSLLQRRGGMGEAVVLDRPRAAYLLRLPSKSWLDVTVVEAAARRLVDSPSFDVNLSRAAVEAYRGHLFPEEGDAEWIVNERDRLCYLAARVATASARYALAQQDTTTALAYANRAVSINRSDGDAWQTLISTHRIVGNHIAVRRLTLRYRRVLQQLDAEGAASMRPPA